MSLQQLDQSISVYTTRWEHVFVWWNQFRAAEHSVVKFQTSANYAV